MPYVVDFNEVSTVGLESSPVASALAGLRANEARYYKNKYDHVFTVEPADDAKAMGPWTIVTRDDGLKQWAYKGKPVYAFVKDGKPGDTVGDGFLNGAWHIAKP